MSRTDTSNFKALTVRQDPEDRVSSDVLASSIREIAKALRELSEGPLNEKAIAVLVCNAIPEGYHISMKSVERVLEAAYSLESKYIKKGR